MYRLSFHPELCRNDTQKSVFFVFSAIYNYNPRGEQELHLQVGDAVHILEKLEGKPSLNTWLE